MPVTINGTTGITTPALVNGTALAFRNKIINGAMTIDQRYGGASAVIGVGAFPYILDRWQMFTVGANVTMQQVSSGIAKIPNALQITGAASNTGFSIYQKIESKNISDLAGSPITLSVFLSNSLNSTVTWVASYANSLDNFTSVTQISTGTFTVNNTLTQYSTQITLPSNAVNGVQILFSCSNQTSGTFKITGVQLEEGSVATPFENRPIGTELALCQRYYELVGTQVRFTYFCDATAGRSLEGFVKFSTPKRANPTLAGTFFYSNASGGTFAFAHPYNVTVNWLSGGALGQTIFQIDSLTASAEL